MSVRATTTFEQIALDDPEGHWELYRGMPRRKPGMTYEHNETMHELGFQRHGQLDRDRYRVRINTGHARRTERTYFIPDVFVIPVAFTDVLRGQTDRLEAYGATHCRSSSRFGLAPPATTMSRRSSPSTGGAETSKSGAFTPTSAR